MDSFLSLDAPEALFTSGAKMAPKNPSAALFERNLRSIKRHIGTHLHARLTKIHETQNLQSRVVGTPANGPVQGTLNIDLGRVRLYSTNAEDYAAGQVGAFLTKPYRFILPIIAPEKFQMPRLHDMALSIDEWVTQAGLTELRYKDAGHLVSIGLGLGLHIPRLLSALPVRNLIIVEPVLEFVYHSLSVLPWHEIIQHFERIGGGIDIRVGENGHLLGSELVNSLRETCFAELDGSYFIQHYQSDSLAQTVASLNEQAELLRSIHGFFEDECVMMRNAMANLRHRPHRFLDGKIPQEKRDLPLILIGSGPSIDRSIDKLRELQDKAILMTCGTGIGAILRAGIKPDFHCEMENTIYVSKTLNVINGEHDFSDITLVGPNTLHPDVVNLFDNHVLFFRDGVAPTQLLHGDSEMKLASPSVANTGFRAALSMGFTEFYLFGIDLGSKDREQHHSENSVYRKGVEQWARISGERRLPIKVASNRGDVVYTSAPFLMTRMFLEKLIALSDARGVHNTGDGIQIKGASPIKIDDVSLPTPKSNKRDLLTQYLEALPFIGAGQSFDPDALQKLKNRFDANMDHAKHILEEEDFPLHTVMAKLYPVLLQNRHEDDGNLPSITARLMSSGTLIVSMQMAYFVFRRLKGPSKTAEFANFWRGHMLTLIDGMKSDIETLVSEIEGDDSISKTSDDGTRPQPAA